MLELSPDFTIRKLAARMGIQPSYISKVERKEVPPPSEETITRLAEALQEDPDILLAMAGKVSSDLRQVIVNRPKLFAGLIRQLKNKPDHVILRVVRDAQDGDK